GNGERRSTSFAPHCAVSDRSGESRVNSGASFNAPVEEALSGGRGEVGARPQGRPKARAPSPRGIGSGTPETRGRDQEYELLPADEMARTDPHREKRVRIAYVTETYPPEVNGVALTVERTVRWLRERGHDLDLIRPRQRTEGPCCDDNEWRTFGLPIPMYPQLRFGVATSGGLRERFERLAPQLVHVATQGPLGYAALSAANALGLPVTTDFRTNFHSYSRYYHLGFCEPVARYYLRAFHNRADRTFVPARALRAQLM